MKHNHVRLWDECKSGISFGFCFQEELPKTQEQKAYARTKIFLMKENGKSHRVRKIKENLLDGQNEEFIGWLWILRLKIKEDKVEDLECSI